MVSRGLDRLVATEATSLPAATDSVVGRELEATDGADPYTDVFSRVSGFLKSLLVTPSANVAEGDLEDAELEDDD